MDSTSHGVLSYPLYTNSYNQLRTSQLNISKLLASFSLTLLFQHLFDVHLLVSISIDGVLKLARVSPRQQLRQSLLV